MIHEYMFIIGNRVVVHTFPLDLGYVHKRRYLLHAAPADGSHKVAASR